MTDDARPCLVMTVGLPRSGKSTWAKQQGVPIVCPDAIRLALHGQSFVAVAEPFVWAIARVMVRALFGSGHARVVLDATSTTRARRDEWRDRAWRRQFVVLLTSASVCFERARADGAQELIDVIARQLQRYEAPQTKELDAGDEAIVWANTSSDR